MALEHRLDLRRRDVLASRDDGVGGAAGDAQRAAGLQLAQVPVRSQPSGPAAPRATVGPLTRISPSSAMRTRVQNSGAPAVATCEQASVRP